MIEASGPMLNNWNNELRFCYYSDKWTANWDNCHLMEVKLAFLRYKQVAKFISIRHAIDFITMRRREKKTRARCDGWYCNGIRLLEQ